MLCVCGVWEFMSILRISSQRNFTPFNKLLWLLFRRNTSLARHNWNVLKETSLVIGFAFQRTKKHHLSHQFTVLLLSNANNYIHPFDNSLALIYLSCILKTYLFIHSKIYLYICRISHLMRATLTKTQYIRRLIIFIFFIFLLFSYSLANSVKMRNEFDIQSLQQQQKHRLDTEIYCTCSLHNQQIAFNTNAKQL